MAINIMKAVIAGGVGVVDEVAERNDKTAGRTESFKNATDIYRTAAVVIGYGLQVFMPKYASFGDTLATAATPLFVKSLAKPVMGAVSGNSAPAAERYFAPRRAASGLRAGLGAEENRYVGLT